MNPVKIKLPTRCSPAGQRAPKSLGKIVERMWNTSGYIMLRIPPLVPDRGQTRGGILNLLDFFKKSAIPPYFGHFFTLKFFRPSADFLKNPPLVPDRGQTRGGILKKGGFLTLYTLIPGSLLYDRCPRNGTKKWLTSRSLSECYTPDGGP